jgi:hypothetical protein
MRVVPGCLKEVDVVGCTVVRRSGGRVSVVVERIGSSYLGAGVVCWVAVLFVAYAILPASADAYAEIERPPVFSSAAGLPNGRVYEQVVSQSELNGNEAGAGTAAYNVGGTDHYGYASPGGESVLFEGTGAIGESPWAASQYFVASKRQGVPGWSTRALLPAGQKTLVEVGGTTAVLPSYLDPSEDLTHAMVNGHNVTYGPTPERCFDQLYLAGSDPFVAATWLERPSAELEPSPSCSSGVPVGGTPDFSTVYFTVPGVLLAQDAARASHAEAWGFYEDTAGVLREAGVLPDGSLDPFGAVPAASGHGRNPAGNQVAGEGTRAFFVSPDPASCEPGGQNDCSTDPPELYVREGGEQSVLVSKDTLLAGVGGLPVGAPDGVWQMPDPVFQENGTPQVDGSYVFASADGSQAFFQSTDALTQAAREVSPAPEVKTYDFDLETDVLAYLPDVVGEIVATDADGSSIAFVRPEEEGAPAELDIWTAGAEGAADGTITSVTQLPGQPSTGQVSGSSTKPLVYVEDARISTDGGVLVFTTNTDLSGAFNSGGQEQIYRYDVPARTLGCVSCAPAGEVSRGPASMTALQAGETYEAIWHVGQERGMLDSSGMSSDGDMIFFDSPNPLVARDRNSDAPGLACGEEELCPQGRDIYEWENGVVSLISGGVGTRNALLLGNSEDGSDVFFASNEALTAGSEAGGYDVFDARVPRPGESTSMGGGVCEGSACEGPQSPVAPSAASAGATFAGAGNPPAAVASEPGGTKPKSAAELRALARKRALAACKRDKHRTRRLACERAARKRYGRAAAMDASERRGASR